MRLIAAALAALLTTPALATSPPPNTCGNGVTCQMEEGRSYEAKTPHGWDGDSALPVLIHFHGWGRTGRNVVRNKRIVGATDTHGMLLLAPNGLGKSWSFWGDSRDDIHFVEAMLDEATRRWKVDRTQVYVSGFSYGSAMAWALACDQGDQYAGFLGVAGTLSSLARRECRTGPFTLRQVHGKKDNVMRAPWSDGGGRSAFQRVLTLSGCQRNLATSEQAGRYQRDRWASCTGEHSVQLDTHKGGHFIPKGWLEAQLRELLSR